MNRAWLIISLLATTSLWVVSATFFRHNSEFDFLNGAEKVASRDVTFRKGNPTHIEVFNLHMPFEEAWSKVQSELCAGHGWRYGMYSRDCQSFSLNGAQHVSLARGRLDSAQDVVAGTEETDTYVEIEKRQR